MRTLPKRTTLQAQSNTDEYLPEGLHLNPVNEHLTKLGMKGPRADSYIQMNMKDRDETDRRHGRQELVTWEIGMDGGHGVIPLNPRLA